MFGTTDTDVIISYDIRSMIKSMIKSFDFQNVNPGIETIRNVRKYK